MSDLYQIRLRNLTVGVVVENWQVIEAAPVLKRFLYANFQTLLLWVKSHGGEVLYVPPEE